MKNKISLLSLSLFLVVSLRLSAQEILEDTAGEFAPNFEYITPADEAVYQLSDLKGEVVYISFWASWCKPCIQGFEKYKSIRREMAEAGVVLLNISIDQDLDKWRNAIESYDIRGIHGRGLPLALQESYQLYNVPRYEIVGKQGQFLYIDREGGKTVMDNFQEFLRK